MIIPGMRTPPADTSKEVTEDYIKAVNLNAKINISAQMAQQNLYEMCMGFKEMRDSKLYKELGYSDFGDYCEKETGFQRRQVYRYISIAENLPEDFVTPVSQIGMRKLYLLTTLSEEERKEIVANTDLEKTSVRELEAKIKAEKAASKEKDAKIAALEAEKAKIQREYESESSDNIYLMEKNSRLEEQIKELESRPVDVETVTQEVIPDDYIHKSAYERVVKEHAIEIRQMEMDETKRRQADHKEFEREKKELNNQLEETRKQLEEAKNKPPETVTVSDGAEVFKAYFTSAYNALNVLVGFAQEHEEFIPKVARFIEEIKNSVEVKQNV